MLFQDAKEVIKDGLTLGRSSWAFEEIVIVIGFNCLNQLLGNQVDKTAINAVFTIKILF